MSQEDLDAKLAQVQALLKECEEIAREKSLSFDVSLGEEAGVRYSPDHEAYERTGWLPSELC